MDIQQLNINDVVLVEQEGYSKPQMFLVRQVGDYPKAKNNRGDVVHIVRKITTDDIYVNAVAAHTLVKADLTTINVGELAKRVQATHKSPQRLKQYIKKRYTIPFDEFSGKDVQEMFEIKALLAQAKTQL